MPAWWPKSSSPKETKKKKKGTTRNSDLGNSNPILSPPGALPLAASGLVAAKQGDLKLRSGAGSCFGSELDQLGSRGHPLPRPTVFSPGDPLSSVSSDGSSGSCCDLGVTNFGYFEASEATKDISSRHAHNGIHDHQQFTEKQLHSSSAGLECIRPLNGFTPSFASPSRNNNDLSYSQMIEPDVSFQITSGYSLSPPRISTDTKVSLAHRRHSAHPSLAPSPRDRSPAPGSRLHGASTPPLRSRPESPIPIRDDGRSECHPLPLPPSFPYSPTSPTQNGSSSSSNSSTPQGPAGVGFPKSGSGNNDIFMKSKWKKGKLLGRGTFGHVYVGFNSESGQFCAIKEVKLISDDQNSKESLKQLSQEITTLSQLSHPNIVQYYGSEMDDETLSVFLEYVSGGSIHKLLQEFGQFKEPVIRNYTAQILSGLAYLHQGSTVHRDIKGANVLVDSNGVVKLADFGMAKHIGSCSSPLSFKGSPYWMAPEIIINKNGYNWAVDIWSLGCTILEMATAKPPWIQYEGVAAIFKIGNSKEIPPIPDDLSDEAKNFLLLCLQRDQSARPTAAQLLDHPFVRDQVATNVQKINNSLTDPRISSPYYSLSTSPNHTSIPLSGSTRNSPIHDVDYKSYRSFGFRITHQASSGEELLMWRRNMSLPVSPSASPLRQLTTARGSGFLSPPHLPSMSSQGGGYHSPTELPSLPRMQWNSARMDREMYQMTLTPDGSPRSRTMVATTPDGSPRSRTMYRQ